MKQWEYYDSSGRMIGVQKWNSIMQQWEYYEEKNPTSTYKEVTPYQSPYDVNAIGKALLYKQQQRDSNYSLIMDRVNTFNRVIDRATDIECFFSDQKWQQLISYAGQLDKALTGDLSSNTLTQNIISSLDNNIRIVESWIRDCQQNQSNNYNKQANKENIKQKESSNNKIYSPGVYAVYNMSPILDRPDTKNGKILLNVENGIIRIIEKVQNVDFYRVQSGNIKGYMWKGWIK